MICLASLPVTGLTDATRSDTRGICTNSTHATSDVQHIFCRNLNHVRRRPKIILSSPASVRPYKNGCHCLHDDVSVPSDIEEPPDEDESMKEPKQRDGSDPVSDSELVGFVTI
jgi:hypothetical protein